MTDVDAPELRAAGTAYATVDGRQVRYRTAGTGEPVLLLHGIGCSIEDWDEQFDRLADRYRLVALDLPGFAFSERLDRSADLTAYAQFLPGFLAELGIAGPVHAVGNSLGGAVAMSLAARHPDLVHTLTLVNSAGFGREVTLALRLLAVPLLGKRLLRPSMESSSRSVRAIFHDRSFATTERTEFAYSLASRPAHAATLVEMADSLGTVRGVRTRWRRDLLARLAPLRIPTLILWGERDLVLPALHLPAAAGALPHAETHLFPDTGHMPQIERPDEFAQITGAFLGRHPMMGLTMPDP